MGRVHLMFLYNIFTVWAFSHFRLYGFLPAFLFLPSISSPSYSHSQDFTSSSILNICYYDRNASHPHVLDASTQYQIFVCLDWIISTNVNSKEIHSTEKNLYKASIVQDNKFPLAPIEPVW